MKTPRLTVSTVVCLMWLGVGIWAVTSASWDDSPPSSKPWGFWKCAVIYWMTFVWPISIGYWAGQENKDK